MSSAITERRTAVESDGGVYSFAVAINSDGYWIPRSMTEERLGDFLAMRYYSGDNVQFRIYDVDVDGGLRECRLVARPWVFDSDDWADAQWEIRLIENDELVGMACARIDGRA